MVHLIMGVLAVVAGLLGVFIWWDDFGLVLRGMLPIALIIVGLVAFGAGLGEAMRAREGELGQHER